MVCVFRVLLDFLHVHYRPTCTCHLAIRVWPVIWSSRIHGQIIILLLPKRLISLNQPQCFPIRQSVRTVLCIGAYNSTGIFFCVFLFQSVLDLSLTCTPVSAFVFASLSSCLYSICQCPVPSYLRLHSVSLPAFLTYAYLSAHQTFRLPLCCFCLLTYLSVFLSSLSSYIYLVYCLIAFLQPAFLALYPLYNYIPALLPSWLLSCLPAHLPVCLFACLSACVFPSLFLHISVHPFSLFTWLVIRRKSNSPTNCVVHSWQDTRPSIDSKRFHSERIFCCLWAIYPLRWTRLGLNGIRQKTDHIRKEMHHTSEIYVRSLSEVALPSLFLSPKI